MVVLPRRMVMTGGGSRGSLRRVRGGPFFVGFEGCAEAGWGARDCAGTRTYFLRGSAGRAPITHAAMMQLHVCNGTVWMNTVGGLESSANLFRRILSCLLDDVAYI